MTVIVRDVDPLVWSDVPPHPQKDIFYCLPARLLARPLDCSHAFPLETMHPLAQAVRQAVGRQVGGRLI